MKHAIEQLNFEMQKLKKNNSFTKLSRIFCKYNLFLYRRKPQLYAFLMQAQNLYVVIMLFSVAALDEKTRISDIKRICNGLGIASPNTITSIIEYLIIKRFINVRRTVEDKRVRSIILTLEGEKIIKTMHHIFLMTKEKIINSTKSGENKRNPEVYEFCSSLMKYLQMGITLADLVPDAIFFFKRKYGLIIILHLYITYINLSKHDDFGVSFNELGNELNISRCHVKLIFEEACNKGYLFKSNSGKFFVNHKLTNLVENYIAATLVLST